MNTDEHRLTKVMVAPITVLFLMTGQASAQPCGGYEVSTVISAPGCPDPFCPATHVRDLSEPIHGGLPYLVGEITQLGFDDAFLWTSKTGMILLDMPPGTFASRAKGISPDGRFVVGDYDLSTDSLNDLGFLLDDGKFIEINPPSPPPSGAFSQPVAVNTKRQVAGTTVDPISGFKRAFLWQDGEMTLIEPTFGPRTSARDINEAGTIVGWMGTSTSDRHGFVWQNGGVLDLGIIPGGSTGAATAVNAATQIAVGGKFNDDHPQGFISGGFLWEKGKWTDLGMLSGFDSMLLTGINDARQIVGWSRDIQGKQHPDTGFVWQNGVMTNLNDLLPPDSQLFIFRASAINNAGQITGRAGDANNNVVTFILTPIEPPVGDLDRDCAVGVKDLLMLLANWRPCDDCGACPADLDGDCLVGVKDLLILLGNWS